MPSEQTRIATNDGECPAHILTPTSQGPWPAVIFYMDAGGIRPTIIAMAQRLADAGFVVIVPDLFYRYGPYGPFVPKEVFAGDFRAILGPLVTTTGNDKAAEDTGSLLSYLSMRNDVADLPVGAVGFCMGGGMALAAAATYPDRFAAVACFHGGNLATDLPTSPHLLVPQLHAEVYIAAASSDDSYPPAMAERLERTLVDADVRYRAEIYPAAHGWMMPDFPVYDPVAAERGWSELLTLFERQLRRDGAGY